MKFNNMIESEKIMKIKEGFVYREIMGQGVVVPTEKASMEFSGMVKLNETGAFIWKKIQQGGSIEVIVEELLKEYDVSKEQAEASVQRFVSDMTQKGILE